MSDAPVRDVLVIGEALIDIVDRGGVREEYPGGSPANVALGLGRMGVKTSFLTCLGRDARGQRIVDWLAESQVEVLKSSRAVATTSTAEATISADGHASYVFDVVWTLPDEPIPFRPRVVHTGSIAAFLAPGAGTVEAHLSGLGAEEISFDPNIRPALLGSHAEVVETFERIASIATVVKMSDEDAAWLYPGNDPATVIDTVLRFGPRLTAVTLGGAGAIVASARDRVQIPAVPVTVADTIGAGDTFMASLIHSLLRRGSSAFEVDVLQEIGAAAVRAAAITVSRPGADLPWARELVQ